VIELFIALLMGYSNTFHFFPAPANWSYGYPAGPLGSDTAADVKMQYIFDEAATPLICEVTGVQADEVGAPSYNNTGLGVPYEDLEPYVIYSPNTYHRKAGLTTEYEIDGTQGITMEFWAIFPHLVPGGSNRNPGVFTTRNIFPGNGYGIVVDLYPPDPNLGGGGIWINGTVTQDAQFSKTSTGIAVFGAGFTGDLFYNALRGDGEPHKIRMLMHPNQVSAWQIFVDGVDWTWAIISNGDSTSIDGTVPAPEIWLGTHPLQGGEEEMQLLEVRVSEGISNNSGGPQGG